MTVRGFVGGAVRRRAERGGQDGHLMVALMVFITIMMIVMTKASQAWVDVKQREDEAEMMFRAGEYARAIVKYRQDHGGQLPTELKQLIEPGNRRQYFLRRLYEDPLVDGGKWGLLYQGPDNSIIDPSVAPPDGGFGLGDRGPLRGEGRPQVGRRRGPRQAGSFPGGSPEVGGLPIVGVKTLCKKTPFRVYKDLAEYGLWHFTIFDVLMRQRAPTVGPGAGGPPGTPPKPPGS